MNRALEIELLRRVLALYAERSTSLASAPRRQRTAVYTSRARHDAEVAGLLRGRPLVVGASCEVSAPGTFFTVDAGLVPVLVVRGADGQLRAFLNACRHRGSAVASGRGAGAQGFTCRYHAWSYDLLGVVRARPLARAAFDGCVDASRLVELPCSEQGGLVVVGTAPDCELHDVLGGYAEEIASHALAGYRLVGERSRAWDFNWKLGVETFMESYHIFSLHRDTLARQLESAPMLCEFAGPHGRGVVMGRDCPQLIERPESEWSRFHKATWVYWLFPNTVLSMPQSGHAELWTFVPADDRPDRSTIHVRFYAAPGAPQDDAFWERLIAFTMGVVDAEDFGQQCLIQRGVASGLLPEIVFGRNEPALIHFHEALDAALGESSVAG